jgi:hypothetical protein
MIMLGRVALDPTRKIKTLVVEEATLGNCKYCGEPAGLLQGKHAECEEKYLALQHHIQDGRQRIVAEVLKFIKETENYCELEKKISGIENNCHVQQSERKNLLIKGWEDTVEQFLDDRILDESEETKLVKFKEYFTLTQDDLDKNGAMTKLTKAAVLRDVLNGIIPQRFSIAGNLNVNLQKSEQVVWIFPGSKYLEDKTLRHYVGGSQGAGIRIMKGVYYRVGAFKAYPIENTERVHADTGNLVVANKNIYFTGPQKSFRIPYPKIVTFEPFSDGIGIMRDAASAKPQIFVTGDGWFTYNLVMNLSQIH